MTTIDKGLQQTLTQIQPFDGTLPTSTGKDFLRELGLIDQENRRTMVGEAVAQMLGQLQRDNEAELKRREEEVSAKLTQDYAQELSGADRSRVPASVIQSSVSAMPPKGPASSK